MQCGVCGRQVSWESTGLPALEERVRQHKDVTWGAGWSKNCSATWACSSCVKTGRALPGDPVLQTVGGYSPVYLAYWDVERCCDHCGSSFVFTAREQQYGYEVLRFHTRAVPTGCPDCRRVLRHRKAANRSLAERLRSADLKNWEELVELSPLYLEAGSKKKALEALRRARNLCRDEHVRQTLSEELRKVEAATLPIWPNRQFARLRLLEGWPQCPTRWVAETASKARSFLSPEGLERMESILAKWRQAHEQWRRRSDRSR